MNTQASRDSETGVEDNRKERSEVWTQGKVSELEVSQSSHDGPKVGYTAKLPFVLYQPHGQFRVREAFCFFQEFFCG